ncbi:MAG: type II secretion system F family protein [archaeon]
MTESLLNTKYLKNYKAFSNVLFTGLSKKMDIYFNPLKNALESSNIDILPNTYLTLSLSTSFLAALGSVIMILFETTFISIGPIALASGLIFIPVVSFLLVFSIFYMYPFQKLHQNATNINTNLPFAINHMAAIASAGVPPLKCFEMLAEFGEYGGVSDESRNIVRRVNGFGEDITQSIKYVAQRTPSRDFKDLLYGMLSVIESGGNMKEYLNEMAQLALFNYKLSRKKYINSLSTYADIYTAILIAAPLFLVSILSVMNLVPGTTGVAGMSIIYFMSMGIYVVIPTLNIAFILFITYTQPEI